MLIQSFKFQLRFPVSQVSSAHSIPKIQQSVVYLSLKRIFDFLGGFTLLFLTSPIFVILFLLIKFSSPGPAIFTQQRVGWEGRLFTIYKFRTMFGNAPRYATHPRCSTDRRVTPLGRWLRRLSLDELPQLFNILKGEMSLVGPRPEMPFIVETYDVQQLRRLAVKPGLTGLWQISSDRNEPIHHNLHHDLNYIQHASLVLDWKILVMTPVKLTVGRNWGK